MLAVAKITAKGQTTVPRGRAGGIARLGRRSDRLKADG
jgi:hypothetical protein